MESKQDKKAARAHARQLLSNISAAQREEYSQKAAASFLNSSIYKNADCVAAFYSMPDEVDTLPVIARAFLDKKRVLLPRMVPGSNTMDFYEIDCRVTPGNDTVGGAVIAALDAAIFREKMSGASPNMTGGAAPVLGLEAAAAGMSNDSGLASAPRVPVLQSLLAQTEANEWGIREPLLSLPRVPKEKIPAKAAILVPGLAFAKDGRRLGRGKGFYDRYLSELLAQNSAFAREGKICGYCMEAQIFDDVPTQENDILTAALFF